MPTNLQPTQELKPKGDWPLGGLVYDGSGAAPAPGDVGISDGRIVFVGSAATAGVVSDQTLDVAGRWVAPGFIDAHSHAVLDRDYGKDAIPYLKQGITTRELVIFTRQFATMIDAGLPLVQCLEILSDQQPNKTFKGILREVKSDVEQGSTFADALRKHEKPFDNLYVNLVQAGEIGGILDTILNRLAAFSR